MSDLPEVASPAEQAAAREVRRLRDEQDQRDLALVLSTPSGRRFLGMVVFEVCGVKRADTYADPLALAARAGERNIGLQLLGRAEGQDYQAVLTMLAERENERLELSMRLRRLSQDAEADEPTQPGSAPGDDRPLG